MRHRLLIILGGCAGVLGSGFLGQAAASDTPRLVSAPGSGPAFYCRSGAGGSFTPSLSADGRWVVFLSQAHNLVTNVSQTPHLNVFVRELATGKTTLVSVNTSGMGGGNDNANYACVSSNGQFVAFSSPAGNLVKNDTNGQSDVFVRDLKAGVTTLVSVDTNGAAAALGSGTPLISADGRWVFFESQAPTLVPLPSGYPALDVYARDLLSNRTYLVSVRTDSSGSCSGSLCRSELSSITPDGRSVAFISRNPNLVPNVTNQNAEVYVRDMQSSVTLWASTNVPSYLGASYNSQGLTLSADGGRVAFIAWAPHSPVLLFHHDLPSGTTTVIVPATP